MAITWVGRTTAGILSGADITFTHPAGMVQDDIVYIAGGIGDDGGDYTLSMVTAGYDGAGKLCDLFSSDTEQSHLGVFRKFMGVTPDSTAVFDGQGGTDASVIGAEQVFRGVDLTTPEDATTTTATGINTSIPTPPAITTVTANAWVMTSACFSDNFAYVEGLPPTGYQNLSTNDAYTARTDTELGACGLFYRTNPIASPTTETPGVWNNTDEGTAHSWCAATIALRPAAVAATSLPPRSPTSPAMMSMLVR